MDAAWPQIELVRPEWLAALLILPVLIRFDRRSLAGFSRRRRTATLVLRGLLVVALVLALCGVRAVKPTARQFAVLAVDQSLSITQASRRAADAFVQEALEAAGKDQAAVLPFAVHPFSTLDRDGTNLEAAIELAAAAAPSGYVPRVVLLSDGNQTDGDALAAARETSVPISTVPLGSLAEPEVYVAAIESKASVRVGQLFAVDVVVHSNHDGKGTVRLFKGEKLAEERSAEVVAGDNRIFFIQSLGDVPQEMLTAEVEGFADTIAGNNRMSVPVFSSGRCRVMLVAAGPRQDGPLAAALGQAEMEIQTQPPDALAASAGKLAAYDLVVLSNVPAAALAGRMEALADYVREGGGLLVIGGDQAFTPGGYHGTALEDVLPVWSIAERQPQKPTLAMVLAVDRSGSMKGAAIELAKEATRRAVEMLDPADQLGILAFEDNSHWVVPIRPVGDKGQLQAAIETITAAGGTDLYSALARAYLALDEAFADLKHVIVLTDGASHPGDFEALAREMAAAGITVSTVAVGEEAVAELLDDIARIGGGHFYYCDDASAVPEVFALETAAASKLGIVERPLSPRPPPDAPELPLEPHAPLAGDHFAWDAEAAPSLLGCVLTKARPAARLLLLTEQQDPLLAWWRYGEGTAVAFTSAAEGRWAAAWLRWPGYGPFWVGLARLAMRADSGDDNEFQAKRQRMAVGYPEELRIRPTDRELLKEIARTTGGVFDPAPAELFAPQPKTVPRTAPLWPGLLAAAALLLVADVALRRVTGGRGTGTFFGPKRPEK